MTKIFTISIKGARWRYRLLPQKVFDKIHLGSDAIAMTIENVHRIDFTPEGLNKFVIRHELGHAYMAETATSSADLTAKQVEEVMVDIIALNAENIIKQADRMLIKMRGAKWKK